MPTPQRFHSKVTIERKVPITMRDGVKLTADIYRPKGVDTPLPVLLMRLPYGRAIASTVTYAHPSWYASQGYIVVIQDVRGCGTSEGEFYPFRHEYEDGFDTVHWCAEELVGSTGKVGMYGFSYQGVTQFQAAVMQSPGLVTICPAMASADFYHGWFYFGGAIALEFDLAWALQLTQNYAFFHRVEPQATNLLQAQADLARWLKAAPLEEVEVLQSESVGRFFFDWIQNNLPNDQYWQELNPLSRFSNFDLPALHVAGWADLFIEGTIATYQQAQKYTKQPQYLVAGPWQHMPWLPQVGEIDFGTPAIPNIDRLQIDWFDYWLKGINNGIAKQAPVQAFLMGQNRWLDLLSWSQATDESTVTKFYLREEKRLALEPTQVESELPDIYVYDPRLPNPSSNYGFYDQRSLHQRWDVLVYASDLLEIDLSIAGTPEFMLYAATLVPDTDWVIKLLDIYPDGRQILISMGVLRAKFRHSWTQPEPVPSEEVLNYNIKLRPTCHSFLVGHQVGIAIASSAFPLIERHSNTFTAPSKANVSDFVEATQQIYRSAEFPSHLRLPLLISSESN